jgi:hypothetical protein
MRKVGRVYRCALCDAKLDLPEGSAPRVHIEGASGKPNVRVLSLDGKEIHRCVVSPASGGSPAR